MNWYSHYGKQYGATYDPGISLLSIYPKKEKMKIVIKKDIGTPIFTVAFTITKIWKEPVSIDR